MGSGSEPGCFLTNSNSGTTVAVSKPEPIGNACAKCQPKSIGQPEPVGNTVTFGYSDCFTNSGGYANSNGKRNATTNQHASPNRKRNTAPNQQPKRFGYSGGSPIGQPEPVGNANRECYAYCHP